MLGVPPLAFHQFTQSETSPACPAERVLAQDRRAWLPDAHSTVRAVLLGCGSAVRSVLKHLDAVMLNV